MEILERCSLDVGERQRFAARLKCLENDYHDAVLSGHLFLIDKVGAEVDSIQRDLHKRYVDSNDETPLIEYAKVAPKKRPRAKATATEVTPGCNCGQMMILHDGQFRASCPTCGRIVELTATTAYERSERAADRSSANKEIETAQDMLAMIQGGLGKEGLTGGLVADVAKHQEAILLQLADTYPLRNITIAGVRDVLRDMKLRRFCKIAPHFYYKFTGIDALKLADGELSVIMGTYTKIVNLWREYPKSDGGFKNLPNCRETIYKIIINMAMDDERRDLILSHIYLPEPNTLRKFIREFWEPMITFAESKRIVL